MSEDNVEKKPSLGVVAISFNEETDILGFIENLISWVDEIVIVDDGSSDQTEKICSDAGPKVKFLQMPRKDGEYFSHQRNKGIEASKSDWLLHMDIDERVPPELAEEIVSAIQDADKDGYRYRRLNYFMHRPMRGGGWQSWNLIHLARRELFSFGGMFHESCNLNSAESRVGQLSAKMHHFNEDNFEKRLMKSHLYMEESLTKLMESGTRVSGPLIFWRTFLEFGKKYIYRKGFLDGTPGVIWAMHSASAVYRANAIIWSRQNEIERITLEQELQKMWGHPTAKKNDL